MNNFVLSFSLLLLSSCTALPRGIELPAGHPASPQALEAPPAPASTTLQSPPVSNVSSEEPPAAGSQHRAGAHNHAGKTERPTPLYRCPMHPEVESNVPGQCPKCGMNLQRAGGDQ